MKSIPSAVIAPLLFAILFFSGAHCKKDKPPPAVLPPVTQEGKNTIGFKVNGEVWVPYQKCGIGADPCGEISINYGPPNNASDYFDFQVARSLSNHRSSLTVTSLTPITSLGNKFDSINISYLTGNGVNLGTGYSKTNLSTGIFNITKLDFTNEVVSGIFSFKLFNTSGGNDSVEIKEGRFDFNMNACICR